MEGGGDCVTFSPPEGRIQNMVRNVCVCWAAMMKKPNRLKSLCALPLSSCPLAGGLVIWFLLLITTSLRANKVEFIDLHSHLEFRTTEQEEDRLML